MVEVKGGHTNMAATRIARKETAKKLCRKWKFNLLYFIALG
jgi:hypothetical protein